MAEPQKPPKVQVNIPAGVTYTDSEGALYTVVDLSDVEARSLQLCRAVAFGFAKGQILVVGDDDIATLSKDDFAASSGLGLLDDGLPPAPRKSSDAEHRGYRGVQPRFGKWE